MRKVNGPKYIIMNGSSGCMPDNYMYASTLDSAIEQIENLFDIPRGWKKELRANRIYYFDNPGAMGADYVEIVDNTETSYADIEGGF